MHVRARGIRKSAGRSVKVLAPVKFVLNSSSPSLNVQATVLLLFNEADVVSYADIQAAVKLEDSELRRTLASLSLAKER